MRRGRRGGGYREHRESRRRDTLRRVKVRPTARAVPGLRSRPDDALSDIYDPDTLTHQFYHHADELAYLQHAPVHRAVDPPMPHRLQLPAGRDQKGRVRLLERRVPTGQGLIDLADTPEFRMARWFETTGEVSVAAADPVQYRRMIEGGVPGHERWAYARRRLVEQGVIERAARRERLHEEELAILREAEAERAAGLARLRESDFDFAPTVGVQQGVSSQIDTEYVPIFGGPSNRQLYQYAHWEQTAKAFEQRHHSELAACAVNVNTDFVLGRGLAWNIGNIRVREVWEEFWNRNGMDLRLRVMMDDLTWQGELLVRKTELAKGFLTVRSLDPGSFFEIVTDPLDVETVLYYALQYPTPWQIVNQGLRGQRMAVPTMRYVIDQCPPEEIFHWKANVSSTEKWGRSDFYASLGTLKRHRDWTNAATLKDMLQANLVWSITIDGDQSDVTAFVDDPENSQLPGPGGTFVQNKAVTLAPMHSDVASSQRGGQGSTGQFLVALFATSQNMPVAYFNQTPGGAARAVALTQGDPYVRKVNARQQKLKHFLDHLYEEVMRRAVLAGRLASDAIRGEDADPEWILPTPYEEDRGALFRDLQQARALRVFSHQSIATRMAQELGNTEYDYTEEMEQIDRERDKEGMASWPTDTEIGIQLGVQPAGAEQPGGMPGMPPGMPGEPGAGMPDGGMAEMLAAMGGGEDGNAGDPGGAAEAQAGKGRPGGGMPPQLQSALRQASGGQPDTNLSRRENLLGAGADRSFRRQGASREAEPPELSEFERRFLEAALPGLAPGTTSVLLPTGRIARLVEGEPIAGNLCRGDGGRFSACSFDSAVTAAHVATRGLPGMERKDQRIPTLTKAVDEIAAKGGKADLCQLAPELCGKSFGIPRADMPQIPRAQRDDFMAKLKQDGIAVTHGTNRAGALNPTQGEIDASKVLKFARSISDGSFTNDPLLVSNDGYVLDGHHRWAGQWLVDPDSELDVAVVDLPIRDLVDRARALTTTRRAFGEAERALCESNRVALQQWLAMPAAERVRVLREADNCGTGAGGFQPGNTCGSKAGAGSAGPVESASPPPKDKPVTLVFGGSFNPPHVGHIKAVTDAVDWVKSQGYSVKNVVVAPTANKLLVKKLGADTYPLADRVELMRRSLAGLDIEVSGEPGEEAEAEPGKLRRTQLADWAATKHPGTTVLNVTGSDAAPGHPPKADGPVAYAGDQGSNHEGYYYLAMPRPEGSMSSTTIRTALAKGEPVPAGMMKPAAQEYLRDMMRRRGTLREADNCGTGAGGFQPGNDCAKGDGSAAPETGSARAGAAPDAGGGPKASAAAPAASAPARGAPPFWERDDAPWHDPPDRRLKPDELHEMYSLGYANRREYLQTKAMLTWLQAHPEYQEAARAARSGGEVSHTIVAGMKDPEAVRSDPRFQKRDANGKAIGFDPESIAKRATPDDFTPEVRARHEAIIQKVLGGERTLPKAGEKPRLVLFLGAPGSGKSSALTKEIGDKSTFVEIDPDALKQELPDFTPAQAPAYHEESSYLKNQISKRAFLEGRNVLIDSVWSAYRQMETLVSAAGGYDVEAYGADVAPHETYQGVMRRWWAGGSKTGRFVPAEYVLMKVGRLPQMVLDRLSELPRVKVSKMFDTLDIVRNGPAGKAKLKWERKKP